MVSNRHAQWNKRISARLLILILFMVVQISGCSAEQKDDNGIRFIAPLGSPPVDIVFWSPSDKNKMLVTAGDVGEGRADVYIFDIQTQQKHILATTKYGDLIGGWASSDKEVFLIVGGMTKEYQPNGMWILDINNGTPRYFIDMGYGAWSPDGKSIAMFSTERISGRVARIDLKLVNVETKREKVIYTNSDIDLSFGLVWSPDGQNLIFSLGTSDSSDLHILNLETKNMIRITDGGKNHWPSWSPVDDIIAYVRWPSAGSQSTLHLINSDGSCDVQIPSVEHAWSPTWSPDGRWLGYVGKDGIYILEIEKVLGRDIYQGLCE